MRRNIFFEEHRDAIIVIICILIVIIMCGALPFFCLHLVNKKQTIRLDATTVATKMQGVPIGGHVLTEEEYDAIKDDLSFKTYQEYVSACKSSFSASVPMITATGVNAELFDYCDKYFNLYYGNVRVSPILPMAISNVETPGRADHNITWCSLFPSKFVSTDRIATFCVTDVVSDPVIFNALSKEYSTRDRGALQMSPTYGTNDKAINAMMSGTERDKLKGVSTANYASWVSGASSNPGDRFYLPDILLRTQAAMSYSLQLMARNDYLPDSDAMLVAQLAVSHNTGSGAWYYKDHSHGTGNWISGQHCYDLCAAVAADDMLSVIQDYVTSNTSTYISTEDAIRLWDSVYSEPITSYCRSKTNAAYPIKALYSYLKLSQLYTK